VNQLSGALSEVSIALSSAKVAVVDSSDVGSPAVNSRYNNGPGTLPRGSPALTRETSVY
jgi:hypothetical protein